MTQFDPANFLKLVADSPERLRKCDVYRLLGDCPHEHRTEMAQFVVDNRPELRHEVSDCWMELSGQPLGIVSRDTAEAFGMIGLPNAIVI